MDKLEEIFALQASYEKDLFERRGLHGIAPQEWIQKETLAMIDELGELLNEVNYKWWKNPKPVDYDAVREELVDIFHFLVSMCLKVDMTADDLHRVYVKKNLENVNRQKGLSDKPGYAAADK